MPTLSKIIQKPIPSEWGNEGDAVNVIRTTNFTNEGKIDFSNVVVDYKIQDVNEIELLQNGVFLLLKKIGYFRFELLIRVFES